MFSHFFQVKSFSSLSVSVKNIYIKLNWVSIGFLKHFAIQRLLAKRKKSECRICVCLDLSSYHCSKYALQVDVIISWVWRSCEVLSEDHLKCPCFQNMNMLVVITCDHWKFSIEWAEHIHVQVWSAFEVNQKMNIKKMYLDVPWYLLNL